jgi:threonine synthase
LKYVSTRAEADELSFEQALLTGLARDGGLYLPKTWPAFSKEEIASFARLSYSDLAVKIISPFVEPDLTARELEDLVSRAYAGFAHPAITPLRQSAQNEWLLELYHGPTLAFKDLAMQLLGPLFDHALAKRKQRLTVIGATSGDTGSAAIEALRGRENVDVFMLHPHGRVSEIQRRQMTTIDDRNVHNIAIEGTFDDAQALVKAMFNDLAFRDALGVGGVNSINWARVMAQIVYYFDSALSIGAPHRPISFCVPTGNFGDIFAGYAAKKMGLPIDQLVIATNANDILARCLKTGRYEVANVTPTVSPSMDIQVSSNFERLIFESLNRDGAQTRRLMASLAQSGGFTLPESGLKAIQADFDAARAGEEETMSTLGQWYKSHGELIDPHTAVAVAVAMKIKRDPNTPMITLATAHAAKFSEAVQQASGVAPTLPKQLTELLEKSERFSILPNDLAAVQTFIRDRARVTA